MTAELRNATAVNKALSKNVEKLTRWKSDCSARILATKDVCAKEHGGRIQEAEDRAETLEVLLRDLTVKVSLVIKGFNNQLNSKEGIIQGLTLKCNRLLNASLKEEERIILKKVGVASEHFRAVETLKGSGNKSEDQVIK